MGLFGLSPMFLTTIASAYFTDDSGLRATKYMLFLATLTFFVHLIGTFTLNGPNRNETMNMSPSDFVDENSSLISSEFNSSIVQGSHVPERHFPLKDPSFWLLALLCFCTLGSVSNYVHKILRWKPS
jgi:hypothetical protein